ncbi:transglycosylase domain-containing protein [Alicyclobacillus sacchari]|uniref:transglycosylase domain-containing protein n=1 Tax=Alicyclobacillus sacchari TaxID=392010 RepID=UPI001FB9D721|nr:transglycosylase domain-containing protein [Alicyclobacillus sacchari]
MSSLVRRWISIVTASVILLIVLVGAGFYLAVRMTPFQPGVLEEVHQPSVVYAEDGSRLMSLGSPNTDLTYNQIPKNVQDAIVATEDHTFWTNSGIDIRSIFRSLFVDLSSGSLAQGASTIPEQLAKITYLTDQKTFSRKFKQIALGLQIERNFTKQEILAMYLNRIPLGESSIGIEQAALRYFGIDLKKEPDKLTLADAALLAGLPQAPSAYDPLQHPKAALERRNQVLQNMVHYGYITEAQAEAAAKQPLGVSFHSFPGDGWSSDPLLTNFLLDYLNRHGIPPSEVMQGGLKIYTTIDPAVQNAINEVFWSGKYDSDFPGATTGTVVEGAAVFVDPKTGGILGAAGSRKQGYVPLGLDRVYQASSPGSSIKPIMDYAPALQTGNWTYTSILDNQPQDFGGGYEPQNWEVGGPTRVTLQYGLEWSQNVASVWLLQQIGISTGANMAKADGIPLTSKDYEHLGIAIGGLVNGVTPMEMAGAYTAFDNNGIHSQPYLINRIVNAQGGIIYHEGPQQNQVMSAQTASDMTRLMQDVVDFGTGQSAKLPGWGVAGKTGTVQYDSGLVGSHPNWVRDGWFDGYTPTLVGSIHIGYDESNDEYHMTMSPVDPSANAAQIFHDIIALALQNEQAQQFPEGPYPYITGTAAGVNYVGTTAPAKNPTPTNSISGLHATYNAANNTVSLNWSGSFSSPVTYVITRVSTSGSDETVPVAQTTSTSLTDSSVQPGESYVYTVQATSQQTGQDVGQPVSVSVATGAGSSVGPGNATNGVGPGNTTGPLTGNGTANNTPGNAIFPNNGTNTAGGGGTNTVSNNTVNTTAPTPVAPPSPPAPPGHLNNGGPGHGKGAGGALGSNVVGTGAGLPPNTSNGSVQTNHVALANGSAQANAAASGNGA